MICVSWTEPRGRRKLLSAAAGSALLLGGIMASAHHIANVGRVSILVIACSIHAWTATEYLLLLTRLLLISRSQRRKLLAYIIISLCSISCCAGLLCSDDDEFLLVRLSQILNIAC